MLTSIMANACGPVVLVLLGFSVLWGLIGLILWLRPNLWDIRPPLHPTEEEKIEEDKLYWR